MMALNDLTGRSAGPLARIPYFIHSFKLTQRLITSQYFVIIAYTVMSNKHILILSLGLLFGSSAQTNSYNKWWIVSTLRKLLMRE